MSAAKTKAQNIIDENAVAVFSKSYCPYCTASKTLLSELGAKFYVIEMDQVVPILPPPLHQQTLKKESKTNNLHAQHTDDGADLQSALEEISGQRTVPNIYISQKHIGGNSDLQAKKSQLPNLLREAGAV
ncbi:MAG: hypothetical protein Q9178_000380 [Gyalolechia marmorata]